MLTLTYGFLLPEDGDIGDEIFDALESNIQQLNDHTHDGLDSAKISSASINKLTQAIVSAGWVLQGNGVYRQLVNIVGGRSFDDLLMEYKDTNTDERLYLETVKASGISFYVYSNDASADVTIIYL